MNCIIFFLANVGLKIKLKDLNYKFEPFFKKLNGNNLQFFFFEGVFQVVFLSSIKNRFRIETNLKTDT